MGRSDKGYVDTGKESKRAKNLKKLKKRKEDTGEIRRFPHTLNTGEIRRLDKRIKRLKELKDINNGFLIRKRSKRKNLQEAERTHNSFETERLRRELKMLEDSRKETIHRQSAKVLTKGSYKEKAQQSILSLERQKKLLQTRPSNLDASRKAILYIENQKKLLRNILKGEMPPKESEETLKGKRTIRELLTNAPAPKTPKFPPLLDMRTYTSEPELKISQQNRDKRISKLGLRVRNIQREIKYLEGEVIRRKRKLNQETVGDIRRDRSIVGLEGKYPAKKLDALYAHKMRLQRDIRFLTNEKKKEEKNQRLLIGRQPELGRDGASRRDRIRKQHLRRGIRGYKSRRGKIFEHTRYPLKILFLVILNQKEYDSLFTNDWIIKAGGYNNFGIGIASIYNKIKTRDEGKCDIYVDISEIASKYKNSSDIPQERRDKIEELCREKLSREMKASFFYISDSEPPECPPKITCIIPIHEREKITIETVNILKKQELLDTIILVGDSVFEENIARKLDVTYVEYPNTPLSHKVQAGVDIAKEGNPDAIMVSGSDNWLSANWCAECAPFISQYDVIGTNKWWSARIQSGLPLEILSCHYIDRKDPIGGGRIVTAQALDKVDWGLYSGAQGRSLDIGSWNHLKKHIRKLKVKMVDNIVTLGIKGNWEQRDPYDNIKRSMRLNVKVIDTPEKWLDSTFPEWDTAFKNFEPSFRRKK